MVASVSGMWGSVARIGLIELSTSVTLTAEVTAELPREIGALFTRVSLPRGEATPKSMAEMVESGRLEVAARELADADVGALAFACTTGSLIGGPGFDVELARRLEREAGVPVTTTAGAMLKALEVMGVRRLAVATPYIDSLNDREQDFLRAAGFEVVAIEGLGIEVDREIAEVPPETVVALARRVAGDADAVFISCTNLPTLSVLDSLERELDRPVVSSNAVTLWDVMRLAGAAPRLEGYGSLLAGRWD